MCPGYERGVWRSGDLARDLFDRHLLSFATKFSDWSRITAESAAAELRNAAKTVYTTEKYGRRGEYGELLLHAILRDFFKAEPAVSKLVFKDGPNETVKGFDAVHVSVVENKLQLWLGEVKFYKRVGDAIADVAKELGLHLSDGYLRGEFFHVSKKIDDDWPHADRLRRLIDANTSLDEVFDSLTVPVLLTYESAAVSGNSTLSDEYIAKLTEEAESAWDKFSDKIGIGWDITLWLILLPLESKDGIVETLHERLVAWQNI